RWKLCHQMPQITRWKSQREFSGIGGVSYGARRSVRAARRARCAVRDQTLFSIPESQADRLAPIFGAGSIPETCGEASDTTQARASSSDCAAGRGDSAAEVTGRVLDAARGPLNRGRP